jgi:hypothetical protein
MMCTSRTYRNWLACVGLLALLAMPQPVVAVGNGPDPGDTVNAWYAVRSWVDQLRTPPESDERGTIHVADATGCCVILRSQGRTVGIGTARGDAGSMVRDATRQALSNALGDHAISALPDAIRADAGRRLTIELEVAGPLQPLIGDSFQDFADDIHPLRHGMALRWRDDWAMQYPSRLRLVNNRPDAGRFDGMAIGLGRSPRTIGPAMQQGEATAYRFETIGLAQIDPASPPMELIAGTLHPPVPMKTALSARLTMARDKLIDHITGSMWPGDEQLGAMGTYEPATDRYEPLIAAPLDQALLAFALGRTAQDGRVDAMRRAAALDTALMLLDVLATRDDSERGPGEAAAILLASTSIPDADLKDAHRAMRRQATEQVLAMETAKHEKDIPTSDAHATAMAAYALTLVNEDEVARTLSDRAWNALPMAQHSTLLPWIVWTELELDDTMDPARRRRLDQLRSMLHQRQVPPTDERFGAELSGGYVLGRTPSDVTAQSLRPGAALPSMIGSATLTPIDTRPDELKRMESFARFLLRLQVVSEGATLHRNPARSTGGIRLAAWDARMPPAAQAMALLTMQELLNLPEDPGPDAADPDLY